MIRSIVGIGLKGKRFELPPLGFVFACYQTQIAAIVGIGFNGCALKFIPTLGFISSGVTPAGVAAGRFDMSKPYGLPWTAKRATRTH